MLKIRYRVPSEIFLKGSCGIWYDAIHSENVIFEEVMRQHLKNNDYAYMVDTIRRALIDQRYDSRRYPENEIENCEWDIVIDVLKKIREIAASQQNTNT